MKTYEYAQLVINREKRSISFQTSNTGQEMFWEPQVLKTLDYLGTDGWEVVSYDLHTQTAILKREIREQVVGPKPTEGSTSERIESVVEPVAERTFNLITRRTPAFHLLGIHFGSQNETLQHVNQQKLVGVDIITGNTSIEQAIHYAVGVIMSERDLYENRKFELNIIFLMENYWKQTQKETVNYENPGIVHVIKNHEGTMVQVIQNNDLEAEIAFWRHNRSAQENGNPPGYKLNYSSVEDVLFEIRDEVEVDTTSEITRFLKLLDTEKL